LVSSSNEEKASYKNQDRTKVAQNCNDIRVEIPKFEGKHDPDEFLELLHTIEHIFEYKEVSEDKKVKFIALRLRKYASLR